MELHHLALRTRDLPRLVSFYGDVFGLRVCREDGERSVWLELGRAVMMLERAGDHEPIVAAGSLDLVALQGTLDIEVLRARLRALDIQVEAETDFTVYFRDPDGRRVAFSRYPLSLDR